MSDVSITLLTVTRNGSKMIMHSVKRNKSMLLGYGLFLLVTVIAYSLILHSTSKSAKYIQRILENSNLHNDSLMGNPNTLLMTSNQSDVTDKYSFEARILESVNDTVTPSKSLSNWDKSTDNNMTSPLVNDMPSSTDKLPEKTPTSLIKSVTASIRSAEPIPVTTTNSPSGNPAMTPTHPNNNPVESPINPPDPVATPHVANSFVQPSYPVEKTTVMSPPDICECESLSAHKAVPFAIDELSRIDPRNNRTSLENLSKYHPNMPLMLLRSTDKKCNLMPSVLSIEWRNVHWQKFVGADRNDYLIYSAFYDNRTRTEPKGGVVRLLLLVRGDVDDNYLPWCHLWYNRVEQPVPSRVVRAEFIDWQTRSTERWQTFILTCPAFHPNLKQLVGYVPVGVSLVAYPCDTATNLLKVVGKSNKQKEMYEANMKGKAKSLLPRIGVCGPALYYYYEDFSVHLVEWLELMKAQGVSNVFLYTTNAIHPNILKVLRYYEARGFVELVDFHYPPPYIDEPILVRTWTQAERHKIFSLENIYFTDCILRFKDRHRYLAHIDPDEAPVLLKHESLPSLLADLIKMNEKEYQPSYGLRWNYFILDIEGSREGLKLKPFRVDSEDPSTEVTKIPSYFTIMRHGRKIRDDIDSRHSNMKSIFDTEDVTGINSHTLFACASGYCRGYHHVDQLVAYMGHYRQLCEDKCNHPNNTMEVKEHYRFKDEVVPNTMRTLKTLHLLP